ncbi:MAG: DNA cytosine methyltransferase [Candidatus Sericytochromatia bacterium]
MKVVSLFCGCGGLDFGLKKSGHQIIWANDFDEDSIKTYKENVAEENEVVICKSITEISSENIPDCDLVVGGFPCQGFSVANPYRNEQDKRNFLYEELLRVVKDKKPKFFLGENVQGITNLGGYDTKEDKKNKLGKVFKMILNDFKNIDYNIYWEILNSADYGIPQIRKRVFMIGIRKDINLRFEFPKITHTSKKLNSNLTFDLENIYLKPYKTVGETIGDLPLEYSNEIPNHQGTKHKVKINGYLGNRHTDINRPAPTIVGRGGGSGGPVILPHPSQERRMTVREVARLQTFPDNFIFYGSNSSQYRQIGNAVPVDLAYILGFQLNKLWENYINQNLLTGVK